MMMHCVTLLLDNRLPIIEGCFALVYGSLAIESRRQRPRAVLYGAGAALATALAACAVLVH